MPNTLLTAHSGCDGTKDNSLEYINYALNLGADCLELDIRKDKSGTLVLSHDDGPAHVTLEEAFTMLANHPEKRLNCDVKQDGLELEVYSLARQKQVVGQIVFSGSISKGCWKSASMSSTALPRAWSIPADRAASLP